MMGALRNDFDSFVLETIRTRNGKTKIFCRKSDEKF